MASPVSSSSLPEGPARRSAAPPPGVWLATNKPSPAAESGGTDSNPPASSSSSSSWVSETGLRGAMESSLGSEGGMIATVTAKGTGIVALDEEEAFRPRRPAPPPPPPSSTLATKSTTPSEPVQTSVSAAKTSSNVASLKDVNSRTTAEAATDDGFVSRAEVAPELVRKSTPRRPAPSPFDLSNMALPTATAPSTLFGVAESANPSASDGEHVSSVRQAVSRLNRGSKGTTNFSNSSSLPSSQDLRSTEEFVSPASPISSQISKQEKRRPPGIIAANPIEGTEIISPGSLPGARAINGPVPPPKSPRSSPAKAAFLTAVPNSNNPFEGLPDDFTAAVLETSQPVVPPRPSMTAAVRSSSLGAKPKPSTPISSTASDSELIDTVEKPVLPHRAVSGDAILKQVIKAPPPPPPPKPSSSEPPAVKVVQWDFDASNTPGGLSVKQGDRVAVLSSDNLWCTVTLVVSNSTPVDPGRQIRGLVPKSYLADLQMRTLAKERMPARPPIFDYGKESAFARDLIAVRSVSGDNGPITLPVVRFWGPSARKEHVGDRVQVFIDGKPRAELRMGEAGVPVFAQTQIFAWDLQTLAPHAVEDASVSALHVRFEHVCPELAEARDSPARFAECTLFVWNHDDDVVVSDVDGTITLSDVGGHLNTTLLQKVGYSPNTYAHPGVCALFSFIREKFHCRFLYLTARPLNLCVETRNYLRGLKQDDKVLPLGPCVTDATSYYGSLKREVVDKSSHLFKAEFLAEELRDCFSKAGRTLIEKPVFMAGFGNKDTDAMAYRAAGVHPVLTFIIDKRSVVTAGAGYASELSSYDDPNLLNWIQEMMNLFQNGKLPATPRQD